METDKKKDINMVDENKTDENKTDENKTDEKKSASGFLIKSFFLFLILLALILLAYMFFQKEQEPVSGLLDKISTVDTKITKNKKVNDNKNDKKILKTPIKNVGFNKTLDKVLIVKNSPAVHAEQQVEVSKSYSGIEAIIDKFGDKSILKMINQAETRYSEQEYTAAAEIFLKVGRQFLTISKKDAAALNLYRASEMYAKDFKTIESLAAFVEAAFVKSNILDKNSKFIIDQAKKFLLFSNHPEKPAVSAMLLYVQKKYDKASEAAKKALQKKSRYSSFMKRILETEKSQKSELVPKKNKLADLQINKADLQINKIDSNEIFTESSNIISESQKLVQKGKSESAIKLLRSEIHKSSDSAVLYKALGDVYMKSGNISSAMAYFSRFNSTNPEHQNIHFELAELFIKNNRKYQAKKSLGMVLLVNPNSQLADKARNQILKMEGLK